MEDNSGQRVDGLLQKGVFIQPATKVGIRIHGRHKSGVTKQHRRRMRDVRQISERRHPCVATDNNGLYLLDQNRN